MSARLLTFNTGSSTIKLALFDLDGGAPHEVGRGVLDLHLSPLQLTLKLHGQPRTLALRAPLTESLHEVVDALLAALEDQQALGALAAVGHRVVHGGRRFVGPARVDAAVLDEIDALTPLAPLHQPHSVRLMRALAALRPGLVQTASFDTAFHTTQDELTRRFALPRALFDAGIQRYGFHGLSYAYIARALAERAPDVAAGRVVALHLGNGASLCGMHGGRSVDTSMGFSTLDGVPMGTRCGALDPGVLLHLQQQRGMSLDELQQLLYQQSGLLGVSGLSADARTLQASTAPEAKQALALFARRCAGEAARLAASLGGLDALVFTAGIGEHDAAMRAAVCSRLGFLGVALDDAANAAHAERIGRADAAVPVFVIPTDEELMIAGEAMGVLGV